MYFDKHGRELTFGGQLGRPESYQETKALVNRIDSLYQEDEKVMENISQEVP